MSWQRGGRWHQGGEERKKKRCPWWMSSACVPRGEGLTGLQGRMDAKYSGSGPFETAGKTYKSSYLLHKNSSYISRRRYTGSKPPSPYTHA